MGAINGILIAMALARFVRQTARPRAEEQVIPLLNDYSDVIVSAIHEHGCDVLKLIGDGTQTKLNC